MSTGFEGFVSDARGFLRSLKADNTREFFASNKGTYERDLKAPALQLLDQLSADLTRLTGARINTKLFRPHRDLRFSKDKTPYHTHLHLSWICEGQSAAPLGFFFGISTKYITAGAGLMGLAKEPLTKWRTGVDAHGDEIKAQLAPLIAAGCRMDPPELKRVPAPFSAEHPHGELLKRKSFAAWRDLSETAAVPEDASAVFAEMWPLQALLQAKIFA